MRKSGIVAVLAAVGLAGCQAPTADPAETTPVAAPTTAAPAPAPLDLGVTFDKAAGHRTRPCDGEARCVVVFDPAAEAFMRDLATIKTHAGALEAVAAAEAGFVRDAEGRLMTTFGRFEPVAVEPFSVDGKSGLRAVVTCGISDPETGFHAAAGECLYAVVSDGAQSVVISSSGYGNGYDAAEAAVRSIRFTTD